MVSVYLYHRQEEADNSAASSISCGRPSSQCKCIAQNNVSVSVSSIARRSSISVCARFRGQPGPHHVSVCLLASGHQDSCKATQEEKTFVGAHLHWSTWVGMGGILILLTGVAFQTFKQTATSPFSWNDCNRLAWRKFLTIIVTITVIVLTNSAVHLALQPEGSF